MMSSTIPANLTPATELCCNRLIRRLLFIIVGVAVVLLTTSYSAEPPKQAKASAKAGRPEREPVHLVVKSRADLYQIFSYHPYPYLPNEIRLHGISGRGMYRLTVDAQGAVTQIQILSRFHGSWSNQFGFLPDKNVLQALMRWRAKPGPVRVVDITWMFEVPLGTY